VWIVPASSNKYLLVADIIIQDPSHFQLCYCVPFRLRPFRSVLARRLWWCTAQLWSPAKYRGQPLLAPCLTAQFHWYPSYGTPPLSHANSCHRCLMPALASWHVPFQAVPCLVKPDYSLVAAPRAAGRVHTAPRIITTLIFNDTMSLACVGTLPSYWYRTLGRAALEA
jgi:hypothetical protein